jgi:hypothetical protein
MQTTPTDLASLYNTTSLHTPYEHAQSRLQEYVTGQLSLDRDGKNNPTLFSDRETCAPFKGRQAAAAWESITAKNPKFAAAVNALAEQLEKQGIGTEEAQAAVNALAKEMRNDFFRAFHLHQILEWSGHEGEPSANPQNTYRKFTHDQYTANYLAVRAAEDLPAYLGCAALTDERLHLPSTVVANFIGQVVKSSLLAYEDAHSGFYAEVGPQPVGVTDPNVIVNAIKSHYDGRLASRLSTYLDSQAAIS